MKQLADGVWQLKGLPPDAINVYLVEDVLIDAGTRHAAKRILKQLEGREVNAHALTHAHPDHQGSSDEVCGRLGIPYWVGERDVPFAEDPQAIAGVQPQNPFNRFAMRYWAGPGRNVDRALHAGDEVAGFEVIDVPGHAPGHVAFWRAADGVLILGDVLNSINITTGIRGLHEPKPYLTADPAENRRSARKLGALEPKLALFGHGPPVRDTRRFVEFVSGLAE